MKTIEEFISYIKTLEKKYSFNVLHGNSGDADKTVQREKLIEITKNKKLYIEIGFNAGHSAFLVLSNNPKIKVISFDLGEWEHPRLGKFDYPKIIYKEMKEIYKDRLKCIFGDSKTTVTNYTGEKGDCAFIDGGHSYTNAKIDLANIKKITKENSPILMDDLYGNTPSCEGPTRAWKEALRENLIVEDFRHVIENYGSQRPKPLPQGTTTGFCIGKYK